MTRKIDRLSPRGTVSSSTAAELLNLVCAKREVDAKAENRDRVAALSTFATRRVVLYPADAPSLHALPARPQKLD